MNLADPRPISGNGTVTNLADAANFNPASAVIIADHRRVTLHGKNGVSAALIDLQITSTSCRDGVHVPLATGADLNANVAGIVAIRPAYPACLAAGCEWEMLLDAGAAEYRVWAKGAGTSLTVTGMVL